MQELKTGYETTRINVLVGELLQIKNANQLLVSYFFASKRTEISRQKHESTQEHLFLQMGTHLFSWKFEIIDIYVATVGRNNKNRKVDSNMHLAIVLSSI